MSVSYSKQTVHVVTLYRLASGQWMAGSDWPAAGRNGMSVTSCNTHVVSNRVYVLVCAGQAFNILVPNTSRKFRSG